MSQELRLALNRIIDAGYQVNVDGFEFLQKLDEDKINQTITVALQRAGRATDDIIFFDKAFLNECTVEKREGLFTGKGGLTPLAEEYDSELKIHKELEPDSTGDLGGFVDHFRSRYSQLEKIMRRRIDLRDAINIGALEKMPLKSKVKVIGIISEKRGSGNRLFIELEDPENSITVMTSDEETVRKGLSLLKDQVICVEGVKYKQDLLIANNFIWPDIPSTPPRRSDVPLCAAFLADVHVGSIDFEDKMFNRFINWMNMDIGNKTMQLLASRVKYLIIAGDLVEGIGVYPNQLDDLNIPDIHEQYEHSARLLAEIPDYVEIIIIPGNHDAVRKSLPQPSIPADYAKSLNEDKRIHMLGNPCRVQLHGVESYIAHGKALDEILGTIPGMDFNSPEKGIELLLQCRHLSPMYGAGTQIAPERQDRLVIPSNPDIIHMGHIHVHGIRKYKGSTIIASGGWQGQTSFQKRNNLEPTVGMAPIFDLKTHQITNVNFNGDKKQL